MNENKTEHNPTRTYIPDHPYKILIVGRSASAKTNTFLNLINNQPTQILMKNIYMQKFKIRRMKKNTNI